MSRGYKISEETPDREYFTLVPNYIVNHSSIWEQGIYLTMKRIAGEGGKCFATHETIARMLQISRPSVSRTIPKLINRGWIKEAGTHQGKTHPVKEYQIVDLWKMNSDFYHDQKIRKPENISFEANKKDTSTTEPKIRKPQNLEEEHIEEDILSSRSESSNVKKCPNIKGHKMCVENISSVEKEFGKKFTNFPKQVMALHKMYRAGFTDEQIEKTLNSMEDQPFWKENGWDLMSVAGIIGNGGKKYGI